MSEQEIINLLQSPEIKTDLELAAISNWLQVRTLMRKEVVNNGSCVCPLCNHKTTKYTRSLNKGQYFFLMHLSSKWRFGEWVHYERVKSEVNAKYSANATDYSKLAMFGLIEMKREKDEETGVASGLCQLTQLGKDFLRGKAVIPKHYYFVNNVIVGTSEEKIDFTESQKKFKIKDLYEN